MSLSSLWGEAVVLASASSQSLEFGVLCGEGAQTLFVAGKSFCKDWKLTYVKFLRGYFIRQGREKQRQLWIYRLVCFSILVSQKDSLALSFLWYLLASVEGWRLCSVSQTVYLPPDAQKWGTHSSFYIKSGCHFLILPVTTAQVSVCGLIRPLVTRIAIVIVKVGSRNLPQSHMTGMIYLLGMSWEWEGKDRFCPTLVRHCPKGRLLEVHPAYPLPASNEDLTSLTRKRYMFEHNDEAFN